MYNYRSNVSKGEGKQSFHHYVFSKYEHSTIYFDETYHLIDKTIGTQRIGDQFDFYRSITQDLFSIGL